MKCTSPPPANQLALECRCGTELCYVIIIIFFQCSFAEGKLPSRIKDACDIDSSTIAERFESISGNRIYGVSAWREWCSLERALGPNTMQWLSKVPKQKRSTQYKMKIPGSVTQQKLFLCLVQVYATGKLISFTKNALEVCYKLVVQHHHVGLRDEAQTAMLHNILCHFDKYVQ